MKGPRVRALTLLLWTAGTALAAGERSAGRAETAWDHWRGGPSRPGWVSGPLPVRLAPAWTREFPRPRPAWPDDPRLRFDAVHEPVIAGGRVFVALAGHDQLLALDARTGEEAWRFRAGGPLRFAPAVHGGRVFLASDDGFLYALDARGGSLLWRRRGGPSERRILGNGRLISTWPVRGGPVAGADVVYFAAGIWPFQGVFIHAVSARDGKTVWLNDGSGSLYLRQPHSSPAFAGLAPQGYLALAAGRLIVPNGRAAPAVLDAATGKLIAYDPGRNTRRENAFVACGEGVFAAGGDLYHTATGAYLGALPQGFKLLAGPGVYCARLLEAEPPGEASQVPAHPRSERRGGAGRTLVVEKFRRRTRLDLNARDLTLRWKDVPEPGAYELEFRRGRLIRFEYKTAGGATRSLRVLRARRLSDYRAASGRSERAVEVAFAAPQRTESARNAMRLVAYFDDEALEARLEFQGAESGGTGGKGGGGIQVAAARIASLDALRAERGGKLGRLALLEAAPRELEVRLELTPLWKLSLPLRREAEENPPDSDGGGTGAPGTASRHAGETGAMPALPPEPVMAGAGKELLVAVPGALLRLDEVEGKRGEEAQVRERLQLEGTPGSIACAGGAVLVSTLEGHLHAFREDPRERRRFTLEHVPLRPPSHGVKGARTLLKRTGARAGYVLVLGLDRGELLEGLLAGTEFHAVAVDPDASRVSSIRERLERAGIYGARASCHAGDPATFALPPYFAEVVTSERPEVFARPGVLRNAERALRPYGGTLAVPLPPGGLPRTEPQAGFEVSVEGGWLIVRRSGAPPGAADWTHQYGDSRQSCFSRDRLVKAPLGILWFGGPSHRKVLPRHGHGPSPQVVEGRIIVEGPSGLTAIDLYTGRELWEARLPGLGAPYDNTAHQPGANAIGSNYVSVPGGVYVAYGDGCLRLDPATGRRLGTFTVPRAPHEEKPARWGWLAVSEEVLLGALEPMTFSGSDFEPWEFAKTRSADIDALIARLKRLNGFRLDPRGRTETAAEFLSRNLNRLLDREDLPALAGGREDAGTVVDRLKAALEKTRGEEEARAVRRRLLEAVWPRLPKRRPARPGDRNVWDGTTSRRLAAFDRETGEVLWEVRARSGFRHNAIVAGGGSVFAIDRLPAPVAARYRRRGLAPPAPPRIRAFDLRTGSERWSIAEDVFGTWLGYSEEHDVLLEAGRRSRDTLSDEPSDRMAAYRGADGQVLWRIEESYTGPCMLVRDWIVTQEKAFHTRSGRRVMIPDPITGLPVPWRFARNYGCNYAVASEHLLTFRSAAAGFYDLLRMGGTGNLGGFRSGCTTNLIAAGGVLAAPEYTRTCTCSYQNQTSIVLVHDPEAELWTFNVAPKPHLIRRLGINLGAPGDRRSDDGVLWLEVPVEGGPSPDVEVRTEPEAPDFFRRHSSSVRSGPLRWVAASGALGLERLSVRLLPDLPRDIPYTVRLYFLDPDPNAAPGRRMFDVLLQGETVLDGFDVAAETGGPMRSIVKEFRAVPVRGILEVRVKARGAAPPLLCGLEVETDALRARGF